MVGRYACLLRDIVAIAVSAQTVRRRRGGSVVDDDDDDSGV